MRRILIAGVSLLIFGCQSWNRFWEVGAMGGNVTGVYYPVTARLNSIAESQVITKGQARYAFEKTILTGSGFSIDVENTAFAQTCSVDNSRGIAATGNNGNNIFCTNAFYGFYGTAGSEQFNGIAATSDSGTVVAGSTTSDIVFTSAAPASPVGAAHSGGGVGDIFVMKLNNIGEVEWYNYFGTTAVIESAAGIAATPDGGFVVIGSAANGFISPMHGLNPVCAHSAGGTGDIIVIKLSPQGALQWYTFLGAAASGESAVAITVAGDGSIYTLGNGNSANLCGGTVNPINVQTGTGDMNVVKLDSNGNIVFYEYIGGNGGDTPLAITATPDNGFIVGGSVQSSTGMTNASNMPGPCLNSFAGNLDGIIVRVNSSGTGLWCFYLGEAAGIDQVTGVRIASDNSIIVAGQSSAALNLVSWSVQPTPLLAHSGSTDIFVTKLSLSGVPQWLTYLGSAAAETAGQIAATYDGGLVVIGQAPTSFASMGGLTPLNNHAGGTDWMQTKLSTTGALQWFQFLGSGVADTALSVTETADRSIAVSGSFSATVPTLKGLTPKNAYAGAGTDATVIKLNPSGGI